MKKFILLFLFIIINTFKIYSAVCNASNGSWNSASTWSCGRIPTGGDIITIPVGVTVNNIPSNLNITGSSITIYIYGTLDFENNGKMSLPSGSKIYLYVGGIINSGTGNGNNNLITIGVTDVWSASNGDLNGYLYLDEFCNAKVSCPYLPIKEIFFYLNDNSQFIEIKYMYNSFSDNTKCVIQKSYDATNWFDVYTVYNYVDKEIFYNDYNIKGDSVIYYRVKTIEDNENIYFSEIKSINLNKNIFIIYPNPSSSIINIKTDINDYYIKIYSINGLLLYEYKNLNSIVLDKGFYIIVVITDKISYSQKVIIN